MGSENPYQSPQAEQAENPEPDPTEPPPPRLAVVGLALSVTAVVSIFAVGYLPHPLMILACHVAFCALPGLLLSLFALPHRFAVLGSLLGLFGCFYLATFSLSLERWYRGG